MKKLSNLIAVRYETDFCLVRLGTEGVINQYFEDGVDKSTDAANISYQVAFIE